MKYTLVPIYARNVLFSDYTEQYLKSLEQRAANPQVKKWVTSNLRTYLINEYPAFKHETIKPKDPEWLKKAIERGEDVYDVNIDFRDRQNYLHWIDFLNQYDKPNSIKFISVPQLPAMVRKWNKQLASRKNDIQKNEEGIDVVFPCSNNYQWVSVKSPEALKREGDAMGHCVGGPYYVKGVQQGCTKIFSLRDPSNRSCVTIEYNVPDFSIVQIKGRQNTVPKKYQKYIVDFINSNDNTKFRVDKIGFDDLLPLGYIFDVNKELVPIDSNKGIHVPEFYIYDVSDITIGNLFSDTNITLCPNDELECGNLEACNDIVVGNCHYATLGSLKSQNSITVEDVTLHSIGSINSKTVHILFVNYDGVFFDVNCKGLHLYGENYTLADSKIGTLYADGVNVELGNNVSIDRIDRINNSLNPIIRLGKNNTINSVVICNEDHIKKIPDNFKCSQLNVEIMRLPKIGNNIKTDIIVLFTDYELTSESAIALIGRLVSFLQQIDYKKLFIKGKELKNKLHELDRYVKVDRIV